MAKTTTIEDKAGAAREKVAQIGEEVQGKVREVSAEVKRGAEQAKKEIARGWQQASEKAREGYGEASESLRKGYRKVRKDMDGLTGDVNDYVRDNPGKSILMAAGVGFIVGLLLRNGRNE